MASTSGRQMVGCLLAIAALVILAIVVGRLLNGP